MTDEKFTFIQDVREKKQTARSAWNRNKGKYRAVRLPSDFMTRKEREAMNGEVKSYRLNEPMSWEEFKSMPDDIMTTYIKLIRERFGASDTAVANMMGTTQQTFSRYARALGLGTGRGQEKKRWDKEGFLMWCQGVPVQTELPAKIEETKADEVEVLADSVAPVQEASIIPCSGSMTFDGEAEDALKMVASILGKQFVRLTVHWDSYGLED